MPLVPYIHELLHNLGEQLLVVDVPGLCDSSVEARPLVLRARIWSHGVRVYSDHGGEVMRDASFCTFLPSWLDLSLPFHSSCWSQSADTSLSSYIVATRMCSQLHSLCCLLHSCNKVVYLL